MLKIPLYGKTKLLLAVEYTAVLFDVAKQQNFEVTKEIMEEFEQMILNEFDKNPTYLAVNMTPLILSMYKTR